MLHKLKYLFKSYLELLKNVPSKRYKFNIIINFWLIICKCFCDLYVKINIVEMLEKIFFLLLSYISIFSINIQT